MAETLILVLFPLFASCGQWKHEFPPYPVAARGCRWWVMPPPYQHDQAMEIQWHPPTPTGAIPVPSCHCAPQTPILPCSPSPLACVSALSMSSDSHQPLKCKDTDPFLPCSGSFSHLDRSCLCLSGFAYLSGLRGAGLPCNFMSLKDARMVVDAQFFKLFLFESLRLIASKLFTDQS